MYPQETSFLTILIIAGIVILVIGYFAFTVIRQQRQSLRMQKLNGLAEISLMEKERARIATDLHDDIGPLLSVIKFRVDSVETAVPDEKNELLKASKQLDDVIARMREVSNNLMPVVLQRKGLVHAIEELLQAVKTRENMEVRFTQNLSSDPGEANSLNIYRVIQEIIHNTLKHARATVLEIILTEERKLFSIVCRDNGVGFDHAKLNRESEGIGLRSIRNRVLLMNGNLIVESQPNKGTAYKIEIPIK